jgi:KDO2-lipid IV(A) lauroyltransferase
MWLIRLISRLPMGFWYFVSDVMYPPVYYLLRYRRTVVRSNLTKAFPALSTHQRLTLEKKFYRNLCDQAVETLKSLTISAEELLRRVSISNKEAVETHLAQGMPVIVLVSHSSNWEWLLHANHLSFSAPMDFVYQELTSPLANAFAMEARTHTGGFAIKREDVARVSLRRKKVLRTLGIVSDQFPGKGGDKKYWTRFLGLETAFFAGPNQLAQVLQYPVVYLSLHKVKRGHYSSSVIPLSTPPYEREGVQVMEGFSRELEKQVLQDPANWLWSHKRWKRTRAQDETGS